MANDAIPLNPYQLVRYWRQGGASLMLVALLMLAHWSQAQAQIVNDPPPPPREIGVFPARDFIAASGYRDTDAVTVEVLRFDPTQNQYIVTSRASNIVPLDLRNTPEFDGIVEVNHPGAACWEQVTPDIRGGDIVRLTAVRPDPNTGQLITEIDQTTTANVVVTEPAFNAAPGVITVRGIAADAAGNPLPLDQIEARLVAPGSIFELSGRRTLRAPGDGVLAYDAPGSTHWTATFSNLSANDVQLALAEESRGVWLGRDPLAATEITIFEVGPEVAPGPQAPCTAPIDGPIADPAPALLLYTAQRVGGAGAIQQLTVTNRGQGAFGQLTISELIIAGTHAEDFTVAANSCLTAPVPVGGSCTIDVQFAPLTAGLHRAQLEIQSNAGGGVEVIPLTGVSMDVGAPPAPFAHLLPERLVFATRSAGNASPARSLTLYNLGDADLSVAAIDITGANAADYTNVGAAGCLAGPLPPGASCTIDVSFTPSAPGARDAAATVTTNAANGPVSSALVGRGLQVDNVYNPPLPPVSLGVFPSRDFVSHEGFAADETVTVEVIRHGVVIGVASDIAPIDDPGTATFDGIVEVNHPGAPCWEGVTPDIRAGDIVRATTSRGIAHETYVANVRVTTLPYLAAPGVVRMHGYARDLDGAPYPIGQLEARIINHSSDRFDLSGKRVLLAPGHGVLAYDPIGPENPDGTRWTATFAGLTETDVQRAINPLVGPRIMWLGRDPLALNEITFDEPNEVNGPQAPCSAPAEAPSPDAALSPRSLSFPVRLVGASATRTLRVTNTGTAPLIVTSYDFTGGNAGDFNVAPEGDACLAQSIAPGASCVLVVRFTPTAEGTRVANLRIHDNVIGAPQIVPVSGIGSLTAVPSLLVSATSLVFPATEVATNSAALSLTIGNEGGAPLVFSALSIAGTHAGDFAIAPQSTCVVGSGIEPDTTCTLNVIFRPGFLGTRSAALTIAANAPNSPQQVVLIGSSDIMDGFNDPPKNGVAIEVFPVRDYMLAMGFLPNELVTVQIVRDGVVLAEVVDVIPVDLPDTNGFDGFIEINHGVVGGACWAESVPDIRAGDLVRTIAVDSATLAVTRRDQTLVQEIVVTQPATEVSPGVIEIHGYANDIRFGGRLPLGALEARIIGDNDFALNGRANLRAGAGLDGALAYDTPTGSTWTARFTGLTGADVANAVGGSSVGLWLGRDPLFVNELTHYEFNELPSAAAPCTGVIQGNIVTLAPAMLDFGLGGVPSGAVSRDLTFTNLGPGPVQNLAISGVTGVHRGDFTVTGSTCATPLAVNQSCTISISFQPQAIGVRRAAIVVQSDGVNSPHIAQVGGIGVGAPTVSGFTPARGGIGTLVTVQGSSFTSANAVRINGAPAAFQVLSDSQVRVTVPAGATDGPIEVTNIAGSAQSASNFVIAFDPPVITSFTPLQGVAGATVTINGQNFNGVSEVRFNGTAAAFTVLSATQIRTAVPAGATSGPITVVTENGACASSTAFTVILPPTITGFNPTAQQRGRQVTILGVNFTGVTSVRFGTGAATFTVVNAGQINATVPNAATFGPVTVTGPGGTASSSAFTLIAPPTISSFTPTIGGVGATVTIRGAGFFNVSSVTINRTNVASFQVISGTEIRAVVAPRTTTGMIAVRTNGGTGTSTAVFTVVPPPTITGFTPTSGPVGTTVTVNGTNLNRATEVRFNGTPATFTIVSATQLRAVVPIGATTGGISVVNPGGAAVSATAFRVQ